MLFDSQVIEQFPDEEDCDKQVHYFPQIVPLDQQEIVLLVGFDDIEGNDASYKRSSNTETQVILVY